MDADYDRCAARLYCRRRATAAPAGWAARCRSPAAREVRAEQCSHPQDPEHGTLPEAPGAEMAFHLPAHRLPLGLGNVLGDAAVSDDLHVAVGHEHVHQHAVVVQRVPHAELPEQLQRALARRQIAPQLRQIERALDDEADLPAVALLALADGLLDGTEHRLREACPRAPARRAQVPDQTAEFHGCAPLPATGGPAAAEAPATTAEAPAAEAPAAEPPPTPPSRRPAPRACRSTSHCRRATPTSSVTRKAPSAARPASARA